MKERNKIQTGLAGFLLGFICILILHKAAQVQVYPYDSGVYWGMGKEFGLADFRFQNYGESLRGYVYPFFCYLIQKLSYMGVGVDQWNFWIASGILYSFLFTVLFPETMERMFGIHMGIIKRCVFCDICCCFFKGMIIYPLSDLFAFTFAVLAIYLFVCYMGNEEGELLCKKIILSAGMGFCLGIAYYARPIYLAVILGFFALMLYSIVFEKKLSLLFLLIGLGIAAFPQMLINHTHFHTWSPLVLTAEEGAEMSLYLQQLNWGLVMQKYETNMDLETYGSARMVFRDTIGEKLLNGGVIRSYFLYIKFCIKYFADVAMIYLKHVFNGMDIVYPGVYIWKLNENRFFTQFFNYTFIICGLDGIFYTMKKLKLSKVNLCVSGVYILPVLLVIPTAVETRFFVACHIVLYLFAVNVLLNKQWWKDFWERKWKKSIKYVAFLGICFLLNSQTFNCFGIPLW